MAILTNLYKRALDGNRTLPVAVRFIRVILVTIITMAILCEFAGRGINSDSTVGLLLGIGALFLAMIAAVHSLDSFIDVSHSIPISNVQDAETPDDDYAAAHPAETTPGHVYDDPEMERMTTSASRSAAREDRLH